MRIKARKYEKKLLVTDANNLPYSQVEDFSHFLYTHTSIRMVYDTESAKLSYINHIFNKL